MGVALAGHPLAGLVAGQITEDGLTLLAVVVFGPRCRPGWDPRVPASCSGSATPWARRPS